MGAACLRTTQLESYGPKRLREELPSPGIREHFVEAKGATANVIESVVRQRLILEPPQGRRHTPYESYTMRHRLGLLSRSKHCAKDEEAKYKQQIAFVKYAYIPAASRLRTNLETATNYLLGRTRDSAVHTDGPRHTYDAQYETIHT